MVVRRLAATCTMVGVTMVLAQLVKRAIDDYCSDNQDVADAIDEQTHLFRLREEYLARLSRDSEPDVKTGKLVQEREDSARLEQEPKLTHETRKRSSSEGATPANLEDQPKEPLIRTERNFVVDTACDVVNRIGRRPTSEAGIVAARRLAARIMQEHGHRPAHIVRDLPQVMILVCSPTVAEQRSELRLALGYEVPRERVVSRFTNFYYTSWFLGNKRPGASLR
jgi:hypothetical protein